VVLRDGTQECGELGAGAVEARADGSDGDVEDEGDLLVAEFLEFAENDDLFEEEREIFKTFADGGDGFGTGEVLGGVVVEGGRIEGLVGGVDGDEALGTLEVTPELAASDAAEPGGERGSTLGVVAIGVAEEGEKDLLGDLFGDGGVAAKTKGEAVDERAVAVVESADGFRGSLLRSEEELGV
jgi:hypothetical protein